MENNIPATKSRRTQAYSDGTRVLLCQPWDYLDEGKVDIRKHLDSRWNLPNYGMVLLATIAQKAGHIVKVFDAESELVMNGKGDPAYILDYCIPRLVSRFHPDIVGISCISARWPEAYRMAQAFNHQREKGNNLKLILGGFHPTFEFEKVFQQTPFIDWIHLGESEQSFPHILRGDDPKSLPGIAWQEEGTFRINSPQLRKLDLDALPFPNWRLLDLTYYSAPNRLGIFRRYRKPVRILPLFCSRGCMYKCHFCTYKEQLFQKHSVEYITDYLEYLLLNYKMDAVFSYDSFLFGEHLHGICEEIVRRGLNRRITWLCSLRANTTKREDLSALKRANCWSVFYGFESGSDQMLALMNKRATSENGLRVARYHHELKLPFTACMIFGYPGEQLEDVSATERFLEEAKPFDYSINVFVPMPGSWVYEQLLKDGRILINGPYDYRKYSSYGAEGRSNFTDMDDRTYNLAYQQLMETAVKVSRLTRKEWALPFSAIDDETHNSLYKQLREVAVKATRLARRTTKL